MEKNYVVMTDSSADLNPALEQELGRIKVIDGLDQAEHPLLGQILTVAPGQEIGPGAGAHQAVVAADQKLLGITASLLYQGAERLVGQAV